MSWSIAVLGIVLAGALWLQYGGGRQSVRWAAPEIQVLPENAIRLGGRVGGFVEVVGESNYQGALREMRASAEMRRASDELWAGLEPEPTNPHDPNAVRVHFDGQTVGYLCRADAKEFLKTHIEAIESGRPIFCRARLIGGTFDKPRLGIMLDFMLFKEKRLKQGLDETPRTPKPKRQPSKRGKSKESNPG
jgi:hypothetical protein